MALSPTSSRGAPSGAIPAGGTTGQALEKSSNTDYDTSWQSVANAVSSVFTRTGAVVAANGDYYGALAAALTGATGASRYVGATTSGAPVSGTFAVGDMVVDRAGGVWICTAAGTPGTWGPGVASGSVSNVHIAPGAAIQASKIAGSLASICDTTLGGTSATIDTNTLLGGNIPSTYAHLQLWMQARTNGGGQNDGVLLQFNGDTANNYYSEFNEAVGATPTFNAVESIAAGSMLMGNVPASTVAGANSSAGVIVAEIPNYAGTTFKKSLRASCAYNYTVSANGVRTDDVAGSWNSTAAITRIVVSATNGSFVAGTRFTLIGLG